MLYLLLVLVLLHPMLSLCVDRMRWPASGTT